MDDEVTPVLLILTPPDELGIEVGIPQVADVLRVLHLLLQDGLLLRGRDVFALGVRMLDGINGFRGAGGFLGHEIRRW